LSFSQPAAQFALDLTAKNSTGKGMTVLSVSEDRRPVTFTQDSTHLILQTGGVAGSQHSYTIRYEGIPADGLIISNNKFGKPRLLRRQLAQSRPQLAALRRPSLR
jgi:aminopeptidase N